MQLQLNKIRESNTIDFQDENRDPTSNDIPNKREKNALKWQENQAVNG